MPGVADRSPFAAQASVETRPEDEGVCEKEAETEREGREGEDGGLQRS